MKGSFKRYVSPEVSYISIVNLVKNESILR